MAGHGRFENTETLGTNMLAGFFASVGVGVLLIEAVDLASGTPLDAEGLVTGFGSIGVGACLTGLNSSHEGRRRAAIGAFAATGSLIGVAAMRALTA